MDEVVNIGVREMPCPGCGYDLRATGVVEGGRRCPECGKVWHGELAARLPWVQRGHLGAVRAYLKTVWMVMSRPQVLAQEPWIGRKEAERFHRVSLILATLVGTGFLMGTYFLRSEGWQRWLAVRLPETRDGDWVMEVMFPAFGLTDRVWVMVPMFLAVYLSLAWTMWTYRGMLKVRCGDRWQQKRVERMGFYASALMPVVMGFLGLTVTGLMVEAVAPDWLEMVDEEWKIGVRVLGLAAAFLFFVPMAVLAWHTGRTRWLRMLLMWPGFSLLAVSEWIVVWVAVFWATGYAVIAVTSMIR